MTRGCNRRQTPSDPPLLPQLSQHHKSKKIAIFAVRGHDRAKLARLHVLSSSKTRVVFSSMSMHLERFGAGEGKGRFTNKVYETIFRAVRVRKLHRHVYLAAFIVFSLPLNGLTRTATCTAASLMCNYFCTPCYLLLTTANSDTTTTLHTFGSYFSVQPNVMKFVSLVSVGGYYQWPKLWWKTIREVKTFRFVPPSLLPKRKNDLRGDRGRTLKQAKRQKFAPGSCNLSWQRKRKCCTRQMQLVKNSERRRTKRY